MFFEVCCRHGQSSIVNVQICKQNQTGLPVGVGRQSAGGEGWKKLKLDSVSDARPACMRASQVATAGMSSA